MASKTDNSQKPKDDIINIKQSFIPLPARLTISTPTPTVPGSPEVLGGIALESVPRESGNDIKHACKILKILNMNNSLLRFTFTTFYDIKIHLMVGNLEDLSL